MNRKTVPDWGAAEIFAKGLERDGYRILEMTDERSGVRVTWTDSGSETIPNTPNRESEKTLRKRSDRNVQTH
jgi:hypothetical protein